jgi:hypothetical protein
MTTSKIHTSATRRRSRIRRGLVLGTACAVAAGLTLLVPSSAVANLPGSTFEGNDGNLVVNTAGNEDWANAPHLVTGIDKLSGRTDNAFGQGTKEDDPNVTVVTGSIPPNKNDLTRFYVASEVAGGNNFLYLAWERLVNIGAANLDFEVNKNVTTGFDTNTTGPVTLNRTAGDLLITYDFAGSGTPTLGLLKWVTSGATSQCFSANALPCWGNRVDLSAAGFAQGAVNSAANNPPNGDVVDPIAPSAPRTLTAGLFGEAAINLTAAGVFPAGTCTAFGSTFLKSRSSSSFPAEIKDFIAPQQVNISNCGKVIIHKVTVPTGGTGFPFTSNVSTNPADASNLSFSLDDGGTKTMTNVLAGSYNVTETVASIGNYTLTNIDCSAGDVTPTSTSTATGATVFTIAAEQTLECTYTNTKNKANPSATTAPTLIPQDKATVSGLDNTGVVDGAANKEMTLSLFSTSDCSGTPLYTKTVTVTANGDYVTDNSGVAPTGYTITADGTYKWLVVYNGDSRNNGFTKACGEEQVVVDITP